MTMAFMSDKKEVVETMYGKYNKWEVMKDPVGLFGSRKFYAYKDDKPYRYSFLSLLDAVE